MDSKPSPTDIASHLRYVGMTDADIGTLRAMRTLVEQHADVFVTRFYAHLQAFEGTRKFLTDPRVVERLLNAQRTYMLSLFDAKFDMQYYEHRRAIGKTHFCIGLDFKWYIGAYVLYLEHLIPLALQLYPNDPAKAAQTQNAMHKAMLLDMSIVLEAYHEGDKEALAASKVQVIHQEKLAAVGLLASGLAHEIGNPLASIQAVCDNQMRRNMKSSPAVVEKFKRIRDQVERIAGVVHKLVDFSRPAGAFGAISINDTVAMALSMAKLSRSGKTIQIKTELNDHLPAVRGSSEELSQVFLNLMVNAIDAVHDNDGVVTVTTHNSNGTVKIDIADNGCGISSENKGQLFTPFFTTKDVGQGTGLGLHVSEGIVKRHGGSIRFNSNPGRGSVFTVELPAAAAN